MQTSTSVSSPVKRAPKKKVAVSIPKPTVASKGASRTLYKVSDLGFKDIKTPQMKALVKTVKEAKKDELNSSSFTAQDLVSLAVKKKELSTRQDPLRIFRFYAKRLTDEGYFIKV